MRTKSVPVEIKQFSELRELVITWSDGLITRFKDADLRRVCNCGDCRKAFAVKGHKDISEDIRIIDIIPVGSYAVQLCFDDQHEKGIFPWTYLRQLGCGE